MLLQNSDVECYHYAIPIGSGGRQLLELEQLFFFGTSRCYTDKKIKNFGKWHIIR
jgi:hypothetical protein